jgi:hypothetical protein
MYPKNTSLKSQNDKLQTRPINHFNRRNLRSSGNNQKPNGEQKAVVVSLAKIKKNDIFNLFYYESTQLRGFNVLAKIAGLDPLFGFTKAQLQNTTRARTC